MTRHHARPRPIPVAPGQLQLALVTVIRTDAPALQLLRGGLADAPHPRPVVAIAVRRAA